jgi:hypothetical protein
LECDSTKGLPAELGPREVRASLKETKENLEAERNPVAVAEIKLSQIAAQMLLSAALVGFSD